MSWHTHNYPAAFQLVHNNKALALFARASAFLERFSARRRGMTSHELLEQETGWNFCESDHKYYPPE